MSEECEAVFQLMLVGDYVVGRDSLVRRFCDNEYTECSGIRGVHCKTRKIELDGKTIKLQIWNGNGHERFRSLIRPCFKAKHGFIIVYDVTNKESFVNVTEWLQEIETHATDPDVPRLLVGSKCDLTDRREVGFKEAKEFANMHQMPLIETSAKNDINVKEAFNTMVVEIWKKKLYDEPDKRKTKMPKMIQANISNQGKMYLRNVKGILIGPPGAGKTITLERLTGKMKNISIDGGKASTGIEKPQTVHLYHDTEKKSIVIDKEWSLQSLDHELGTVVLHCMPEPSINQPYTDQPATTTTDLPTTTEHFSTQHISSSTSTTSRNTTQKFQSLVVSAASSVSGAFKKKESVSSLPGLVEKLVEEMKWGEVQKVLRNKHITLFHIIDTGGQPEFYDILPLLLNGPCFALIFINLAHPLSQPFHVTYRHTPDDHSLIQYESIYNQLQMIHMTLANCHSLNSQKGTNNKSAAFILATHLDKADKAEGIDIVEEVMKEIEESMKDASYYKKDVLLKCLLPGGKVHQFLYALNNYSGDEEEISILRSMLTHLIESTFEPERLPTSQGVFHLLLRHKYEEQGLCTLQQGIQLGQMCGLKKESEVKEVLGYFHTRFGTILYYEAIKSLQSVVICDPNLIFRPITTLVSELFGANPQNIETAKGIRITGEIDNDFLREIYAKADISQHIPTSAIIDLLKHHNIITEIKTKDGVRKLFMSCLLKPCPPEEVPKMHSGAAVEPLLFTFHPDSYQPVSLFHVLASKLLISKSFELDVPRYKDKLSFVYGAAKVEIFSNVYYLDIRINPPNPQRCILLRNTLQGILKSIVSKVPHMAGTDVQCAFYCPNSTAESPHSAVLKMNKKRFTSEPFAVLVCEKCKSIPIPLRQSHVIWFEKKAISAVRPPTTLSDEKLYVPQTPSSTFAGEGQSYQHSAVEYSIDSIDDTFLCIDDFITIMTETMNVPDWSCLGHLLGISLADIERIKKDNPLDSQGQQMAIVQKWLESGTASWRALVSALRHPLVNKKDVADIIAQNHQKL